MTAPTPEEIEAAIREALAYHGIRHELREAAIARAAESIADTLRAGRAGESGEWVVGDRVLVEATRASYAWCVPGSWQDEQGGHYTLDKPTHWRPLPPAPG